MKLQMEYLSTFYFTNLLYNLLYFAQYHPRVQKLFGRPSKGVGILNMVSIVISDFSSNSLQIFVIFTHKHSRSYVDQWIDQELYNIVLINT